MPFGLFKKDKPAAMSEKEQRAKLGLKVVMAQQNPEPVYDLTDCAMVELPPDTFVMCKLLQKTSLLLQNNLLTTFEKGGKLGELEALEVLDLSHNKLHHLPDSINKLKKLRVLKVTHNKLKVLPSSLSELSKLQELYLSSNRFSKVPLSICALPKLRVLSLTENNITVLPKEFCELQKSLCTLELNADKIISPPVSVAAKGVEAIMQHLCNEHQVEYHGLEQQDDEEVASPPSSAKSDTSATDEALFNYLSRKEEKVRAQMAVEEEFQAREQEQLAHMLQEVTANKQQLLEEILQTPAEALDYERKKRELLREQYNLEENMRAEQAEQLEKYIASSSDKEALINDLTTQQATLDIEVEGLVSAKEKERQSLLKDLTTLEKDTMDAVQDLIAIAAARRSEEFMSLLQDQEKEMQSLLSGIADAAAELRRSEVVEAMKKVLIEEAAAEQRRQAVQEEQGARVCALLQDADLVNSHLHGVLTTRLADKEEWSSTLLKDEQCQETAFKLLLLKCDLKRNNILRQIGQIEYELARLSSLEVRKKKHGIKYGSSTMLEQRVTLVGLLKCLLKEKSEREVQLTAWLAQLQDMRMGNQEEEEEFWLVQYQRLLAMKPVGLAEAEAKLDPGVQAVLKAANALDLAPVFAHNSVSFARLVDMTEEDAATMDIGPATYRSLQRALQNYLYASKIEDHTPSAPIEEECPYSPSAPEMEGAKAAPSTPFHEGEEVAPSAPPIDKQFVESECVVCLDAGCEKAMVKVKTKVGAGQVAATGMVSGKKKKDQKKVLKVISNRDKIAQPAATFKVKKKNRKTRNKNKSGTQNENPSFTATMEAVAQAPVSESKEQQNGEEKNALSSDTTSHSLKNKKPTSIVTDEQEESMTSEPHEAETKNPNTQETEKENIEADKNKSNTQGKKSKKRKNKRKASETIEGTDSTSEALEKKDDGETDKTGKKKANKRQKLEKKEDEESMGVENGEAKVKTGKKTAKKRQKVEKKDKESMEDENDKAKESKKKKEKKHVLFIGNLPFEATEEEIREHFKVVGDNIVRITLMSRQKNGKGKGYGFLELGTATAYTAALKLNLSEFKGRKMNVEFTTPGKNTKKRKTFIKLKTKKLLGQKGNKSKKKKGGRKH